MYAEKITRRDKKICNIQVEDLQYGYIVVHEKGDVNMPKKMICILEIGI